MCYCRGRPHDIATRFRRDLMSPFHAVSADLPHRDASIVESRVGGGGLRLLILRVDANV